MIIASRKRLAAAFALWKADALANDWPDLCPLDVIEDGYDRVDTLAYYLKAV